MFAFLLIGELLLLFLLSRLLTQHIAQFFYHISHSKKVTVFILAFLFLPGTLIHEVAHFMMARLLFVYAGHMTLLPQIDGTHVKLGSVQIAKTDPIRQMLISVAPFLFGVTILAATLLYGLPYASFDNLLITCLIGYILFEIGNTMFSSRKDMEGTVEFLIALVILGGILYLIGFRPSPHVVYAVLPTSVVHVLEQSTMLFLIPLGIDLGAIVLFRISNTLLQRTS